MADLDRSELLNSVGLFFLTLLSVFWTYGNFWQGGDPFADAGLAWDSLLFSSALMATLLAHELGHFVVARRHGFDLSLPYFIPFPLGFGTLGAIIRLRSLPESRTALVEMGAAGPLAGLVVAVAVMALGMPFTGPPPELVLLDPEPLPWWLDQALRVVEAVLTWGPIGQLTQALSPPPPEGQFAVTILNNPLVMDILGELLNGAPPGRFDTLHPLTMAGWVGCLLTAVNLVPIGQLDGGHILNGLAPRAAPVVSKVLLGLALAAGLIWLGWAVWGVLLLSLGVWRGIEVPADPPLTSRAKAVAVAAGVAFALTFMPAPIEMDSLPLTAQEAQP